jgi:urocanate hydratase
MADSTTPAPDSSRLAAARCILHDYETWTGRGGTTDWQAWANRLAQAAASAVEIAEAAVAERDEKRALNRVLSDHLQTAVAAVRQLQAG